MIGEHGEAPGTCPHCRGPPTVWSRQHRAKPEGRGQRTRPQDAQDETWMLSSAKSRTEKLHLEGPFESRRQRPAGKEAWDQEPAMATVPGTALHGPRDETDRHLDSLLK